MTPEMKIQVTIAKYQVTHKLVNMVREVVQALANRKRVDAGFKTAFLKLYPDYAVSYQRGDWQTQITIWGNGVEYNDRLFMCWNNSALDEKGYSAFADECERCDPWDYIVRLEGEIELLPQLDAIQAKINALKEEAQALCSFKVEGSLVGRNSGYASYTLQEFYPMLKRF